MDLASLLHDLAALTQRSVGAEAVVRVASGPALPEMSGTSAGVDSRRLAGLPPVLDGPGTGVVRGADGQGDGVMQVPLLADDAVVGDLCLLLPRPADAGFAESCLATAGLVSRVISQHLWGRAGWARADELQRSSRVFVAADTRLRKELSQHLHGKVQTSLLAAAFLLDRCEQMIIDRPDEARALMSDVRDEIDRVREEEVREVSHLLHPAVVGIALGPALRSLAARYHDRFTVGVELSDAFQELDEPQANRLPPPLRLTTYRLVEEALANAAQHARPTRTNIAIDVEDGHLVVEVADDGAGFDPFAARSGLGLVGLDHRVQEALGTWTVESSEGQGTVIRARLPVERRARPREPKNTGTASARNPVPLRHD